MAAKQPLTGKCKQLLRAGRIFEMNNSPRSIELKKATTPIESVFHHVIASPSFLVVGTIRSALQLSVLKGGSWFDAHIITALESACNSDGTVHLIATTLVFAT
jgi:hypothetical protein